MVKHIAWKDEYKVGYEVIDTQHQHLFKIADKLYNLVKEDYDDVDVEGLIVECAEYVIFHFNTEEKLMQEINYIAMIEHKTRHQMFNSYISTLIGELTNGNKIDLSSLYSYVADWLVNHIISEDKRLAAEINSFLGK